MPAITYIEFNGTEHSVEAEAGQSVMQAAKDGMVPGIDADCGGSCACGTCHVELANGWHEKFAAPEAMEESLLDLQSERQEGSRLACQVEVLDGMVVKIPEYQM